MDAMLVRPALQPQPYGAPLCKYSNGVMSKKVSKLQKALFHKGTRNLFNLTLTSLSFHLYLCLASCCCFEIVMRYLRRLTCCPD